MANESAFPETEPGQIELKVLPAGKLLESRGTGSYFEDSGGLFRPLFNYIQSHEISMTTPVEARIEPGVMYFWVGASQEDKATANEGGVRVIEIPERKVAAIGVRGAYTRSNFEEARTVLLEWVSGQPGLSVVGEPWAVYWNGPMTPWFLKRSEVQVAVKSAAD